MFDFLRHLVVHRIHCSNRIHHYFNAIEGEKVQLTILMPFKKNIILTTAMGRWAESIIYVVESKIT